MVEAVLRRGRRRDSEPDGRRGRCDYAALGWPVCLGAHLRERPPRPGPPPTAGCATRAAPAPATGSAAPRRPRTHVARLADARRPATRRRSRRWWREPAGGQHHPASPAGSSTCSTCRPRPAPIALALMEPAGVPAGPVALSAPRTGRCSSSPPGCARRRGRVVVVPPGLRAGRRRARCRRCAGTAGTATCWRRRPAPAGGPAAVDPCAGGASAARRAAAARVPGRRLRGGDRVTAADRTPPGFSSRACAVIPGGVNSPVRAFGAVGGAPVFMASGRGPYLTDADGRELRRPGLLLGADDPRATRTRRWSRR